MKTLSARSLRFANLFALAAAFVALCPQSTLAENDGPGSPILPPPVCVVATDGTTIAANAATVQSDGSTTYTTVAVTFPNGTTHIAAWANVTTAGVIKFSDGTIASL